MRGSGHSFPKPQRWEWVVPPKLQAQTLKRFLVEASGFSSASLEELIAFGAVHRNGLRLKDPHALLAAGDVIRLYLPTYGTERFYEANPERIIYRDRWMLAYDKEASIPSHQLPYDDYNNVLEALKRLLARETPHPYAAIHNRLDQEASGLLLFAVHRDANQGLAQAFRLHRIRKRYLLVAEGTPPKDRWSCTLPITKLKGRYALGAHPGDGKAAETHFTVLHRSESRVTLLAEPKTGRTHQIRLHLTASGLRLLGDRLYGGPPAPRLMLHGWRLDLDHPVTGERLSLEAPPPEAFTAFIPS